MRNMFMEAIKTEQKRIQRFIDLSRPKNADRGSLYLQKQDGRVYGYERWQKKGQPSRKIYLGILTSDPVRELFSIKFQAQRLVHLRHNQKLLENLERQYREYDFESVVSGMPKAYRTAADANSFDYRYEELRKWADADYPKNPFPFPDTEIYARDGTRMRSKGECIWYNLLQERGILFRYDCMIEIIDKQGNSKKLCPDFMIQCFDGTFIIIEHLGRMGDPKYALDFGERSYWYFQDNYVFGRNLFVTSDEPHFGTDSQMIVRVVNRVEEMFYGF